MGKNKYIPTISSLYINYVFQGIAAIIVSQNMTVLRANWGASLSQVALVLSAVGLGRILSINFAGLLSDKLGRRWSILLGISSYILFFIGLLLSPNYIWAIVFSVFAGFGNAFLDTGTYPVIIEAFDSSTSNSAVSVLNKAFISMGQFIFPIITRFILRNGYYFGWPFIVSSICLVINLFLTLRLPFPQIKDGKIIEVSKEEGEPLADGALSKRFAGKASFKVEGVALLIFSFVSVSLFNIFITWIPSFGQVFLRMPEEDSVILVSVYSICSFISVFVTSFIVNRGVNVPLLMIFCTSVTGLSLLTMVLFPSLYTAIFATFCVGFFSAGGIWQLGLAVLLEFFPFKRGLLTSYYSLATSISVMGVPYLTGILAEWDLRYVFLLNSLLAFIGSVCLYFVNRRYQIIVYQTTQQGSTI